MKMPRVRYCQVQSCEHFRGTTNKEIHMFKLVKQNDRQFYLNSDELIILISFRFPSNNDERTNAWIDAISKENNNDCNGTGLVCSAHFLSTDVRKKSNGEIGLKENAVPVCFNENFSPPAVDFQSPSLQPHCDECNILKTELNQLKRSLFNAKVESDLELQKKNDQIDTLLCKHDDESFKVKGLKEKIFYLEKIIKENNNELKRLQEQMTQPPKIDVNFEFHIFFPILNGAMQLNIYLLFRISKKRKSSIVYAMGNVE